jgi:hypothetical protein
MTDTTPDRAHVPLGKASISLLFDELRSRSKALALVCILREPTSPETAIRQFYGCDDGGENLRLLGAVNLLHDDVLRDVRSVVMGSPIADSSDEEL